MATKKTATKKTDPVKTDPVKTESVELLELGKRYLVQTATGFWMSGHVVNDSPHVYILGKAAWIADTGRFHQALKLCEFNEVEPLPRPLRLAKQAIVMAIEIEKDQEAVK